MGRPFNGRVGWVVFVFMCAVFTVVFLVQIVNHLEPKLGAKAGHKCFK